MKVCEHGTIFSIRTICQQCTREKITNVEVYCSTHRDSFFENTGCPRCFLEKEVADVLNGRDPHMLDVSGTRILNAAKRLGLVSLSDDGFIIKNN